MPIRIQKSDAPGWQLPGNTVDVEATKWANPYTAENYRFVVGGFGSDQTRPSTAAERARAYRTDITCTDPGCLMDFGDGILTDEHPWMRELNLTELAGKNLACSCPADEPCHADVLLELANPTEEQ